MIIGALTYVGAQLTPFDLAQRQGVAFGLIAALALRGLYIWARHGFDAANEDAERDLLGIGLVTILICAILTIPY